MPVEIREIVLRARVERDSPQDTDAAPVDTNDLETLYDEVMRDVDLRIRTALRRREER